MNLFFKRNSLNNINSKQLFVNIIKIALLRHIKKSLYNIHIFLILVIVIL